MSELKIKELAAHIVNEMNDDDREHFDRDGWQDGLGTNYLSDAYDESADAYDELADAIELLLSDCQPCRRK